MAYNLTKLSRQYRDKKMHEYILGFETNKIVILRNGCHIYKSFRSSPNNYRKFTLNEIENDVVNCQVYGHQLVYFLFTGEVSQNKYEISHLCHNKGCINFEHLHMEPHAINQQRIKCRNHHPNHRGPKTICIGHNEYPDCLSKKAGYQIDNPPPFFFFC